MRKLTNLIATTILLTFFISCKKADDAVTPASGSIVGNWTFTALGIKTDLKSTEATLTEIKKLDPDSGDDLGKTSFELKADGTTISTSDSGTEKGKYKYDAATKTLTITSDVDKQSTSYEVVSLTNTDMVLGIFKSTKKDSMGDFIFNSEDEGALTFLFAAIVYAAKGIDGDAEVTKAKSFQLIFRFKK
jgi:hypothetical protein